MQSSEIKNRKDINEILTAGRTAGAEGFWGWNCPHCGERHFDHQFTKHGKYRECVECRKGVMVVLPY